MWSTWTPHTIHSMKAFLGNQRHVGWREQVLLRVLTGSIVLGAFIAVALAYDLLVSPAVIVPPFDVDIRYVTEVNGVTFDNYIGWLVLSFALTLTACPSLSAPCGFTQAGLPVGLQMTAPRADEASLLSAAALFEEEAGVAGRVPIDPRPAATP